jgi:peptidoglycan/xylan/chitin deacetylase (PgdA/CDA1 family)
MAKEGGGDPFAAKVNGTETADPNTVLKKDDKVEIADGKDTTEQYTEQEETIPHGTVDADTSAGGYWAGSLHVFQKGEDGLKVTRTGEVSGKTVTEEKKPAKDSGYRVYTADPGEDKVIAITFDDGPWPETTDQILDVLEENGAKATFFTIGNQIDDHADAIKREKELGCQVCTHTWDHASGSGQGVNVTYMSADEQVEEVQKGYEAIKDVLGEEPTHVTRMPGGNFYGDAVSNLEPYIDCETGWDVDTEDWRQPGADAIYERLMSVQPGQVILCHDGGGPRSQTVEAVTRAIPELISQGYTFVTVSDLLKYK